MCYCLAVTSGINIFSGVCNVEIAIASLSESSTVVQDAMIQKVGSVDTFDVTFACLSIVKDSVNKIAQPLAEVDLFVITTGFIPRNPLKINNNAHKVDNFGTVTLIDAEKELQ